MRRRPRRWPRGWARRFGAGFTAFLQAPHLLLELLVAILQLLHRAGELADRRFQPIEACEELRGRILSASGAGAERARKSKCKQRSGTDHRDDIFGGWTAPNIARPASKL